jgi:alcohol dehydrogenase class IV
VNLSSYNFPTPIKYGAGAIALLPELLKSAGVKRPLIVTDRGLRDLPPIARVTALLAEAGLNASVFSELFGNPLVSQAEEGGKAFREAKADAIVAVGGGAALDVAKCIAILAHHDGALMEYEAFLKTPRAIDRDIPFIVAVPTTAGTGSEVGRSAVVSDDATHQKKIFFSPRLLAKVVVLDPELTVGLPSATTAATGLDALTHLVESYLCPTFHPMCDGIALEGIRLTAKYLPIAVDFAKRIEAGNTAWLTDSAHVEARGMMLNAAMMGAVAFQKDLGVTHSCAHALSTVVDMHHGLANGVMIPYCMRFNKSVCEVRMAIMAETVRAPSATADGFIEWLFRFNESVGIPRSLRSLNVTSSHLDQLVEFAMKDFCTGLNPKPLTAADFRAIYTEALA